jgi:hypothetical protein
MGLPEKKITTDGSTLKCIVAAAEILANVLPCGCLEKEGYYKTATTLGLWNTNGGQFSFASSLMILALNTWALSTSTISSWSYKGTTKSKPI